MDRWGRERAGGCEWVGGVWVWIWECSLLQDSSLAFVPVRSPAPAAPASTFASIVVRNIVVRKWGMSNFMYLVCSDLSVHSFLL